MLLVAPLIPYLILNKHTERKHLEQDNNKGTLVKHFKQRSIVSHRAALTFAKIHASPQVIQV